MRFGAEIDGFPIGPDINNIRTPNTIGQYQCGPASFASTVPNMDLDGLLQNSFLRDACSVFISTNVYNCASPNCFVCKDGDLIVWAQSTSPEDFQIGGTLSTNEINLFRRIFQQLDNANVGWAGLEFYGLGNGADWSKKGTQNTPNNVIDVDGNCIHDQDYNSNPNEKINLCFSYYNSNYIL